MSGERIAPTVHRLKLADGRGLTWYEFGDTEGVPCFYVPGTPESGLAGSCYDAAARRAGVRWISVDKPGYGHSDPLWNRSLLGFAADLGELADHLGLASFVVAGESGGGRTRSRPVSGSRRGRKPSFSSARPAPGGTVACRAV